MIGAGIIGATITWSLSKNGARVTLVDKLHSSGLGATQSSFGWVGAGALCAIKNPSLFKYRLKAIEDYHSLREELGEMFPITTNTAIVWKQTVEKTIAFVEEHRNSGSNLKSISNSRLKLLEPAMKCLPEVAALAESDFAFNPTALTGTLLQCAKQNGASLHFNTNVIRLETKAGRVSGIQTEQGFESADFVVLANGTSVNLLSDQVGMNVPLSYSPAVLLRFRVHEHLIRHILSCPYLEIRQAKKGMLVVAENLPLNGQDGLHALAKNVEELIRQNFRVTKTIKLESVEMANRPNPEGGWPNAGFLSGVPGLYVAVGHPGVMLAPFIGNKVTSDILFDGYN